MKVGNRSSAIKRGLKARERLVYDRERFIRDDEFNEVLTALERLAVPGQCVALWIKDAQDGVEARTRNRTGYFTDPEALAREALRHSGKALGCYITVNPIDLDAVAPEVLKRASNRLSLYGSPKQEVILQRRWLFIDIDSQRPDKDSCATQSEKDLARAVAEDVRKHLREKGWPEPLMIDSGNGFYLLYRIDLPTDDGGLVHKVLQTLSQLGDEHAKIDTAVAPPKQLMRLPGTMNCKGANTADRPHRLSKLLEAPSTIEVVPKELLEAVAAELTSQSSMPTADVTFDIEEVRKSLDKLPPAVQGKNGSTAATRAAHRIVVAYDVPWDSPEAWELLKHYSARCVPPWNLDDPKKCEDLRRKLREVHERAVKHHQDRGYLRRQGQKRFYEPLDGRWFPVPIPDYDWMGYDTPAIVLDDPPMAYAYGLRLLRAWQRKRPDVLVPDVLVKLAHWGAKAPGDWRQRYLRALNAACSKGLSVRRVAPCAPGCPLHDTKIRHRHYRLPDAPCGCFDDFRCEDGEYVFPEKQWKEYQANGKVYRGYWPVLIFGTSKRVGLTAQQVKLFTVITRELTRLAPKPTGKRKPNGKMIFTRALSDRPDRALVMHGSLVHDSSQDGGMIPCPLLPSGEHVGFDGNLRKHRGKGYTLRTWARRAGYPGVPEDANAAKTFLADLAKLAEMFELTVVGRYHLGREWYSLDKMREMLNTRWGTAILRLCTLRVYARASFLTDWRYTLARKLGFQWIIGGAECPFAIEDQILGEVNNVDELLAWLKSHEVTRTKFAERAGINRRTLYRALVKRTANTWKFWAKVNRAIQEWDI